MDIREWEDRYRSEARAGTTENFGPTKLVVETARKLPTGRALDLACGSGRNALWLAAEGWQVQAIDGAAAAIEMLRESAQTAGLTLRAQVANLQSSSFDLAQAQWDLVIVCYYLQLDLIERAKMAVRPGGVLLMIVHTTEGWEEPTPSRLKPGELEQFFADWGVLHRYEGKRDDSAHQRKVAEIVARRPAEKGSDQAVFAK